MSLFELDAKLTGCVNHAPLPPRAFARPTLYATSCMLYLCTLSSHKLPAVIGPQPHAHVCVHVVLGQVVAVFTGYHFPFVMTSFP